MPRVKITDGPLSIEVESSSESVRALMIRARRSIDRRRSEDVWSAEPDNKANDVQE